MKIQQARPKSDRIDGAGGRYIVTVLQVCLWSFVFIILFVVRFIFSSTYHTSLQVNLKHDLIYYQGNEEQQAEMEKS